MKRKNFPGRKQERRKSALERIEKRIKVLKQRIKEGHTYYFSTLKNLRTIRNNTIRNIDNNELRLSSFYERKKIFT